MTQGCIITKSVKPFTRKSLYLKHADGRLVSHHQLGFLVHLGEMDEGCMIFENRKFPPPQWAANARY